MELSLTHFQVFKAKSLFVLSFIFIERCSEGGAGRSARVWDVPSRFVRSVSF